MKAIFLASGKSSRFAPFREKNFWIFLGKPLIYHLTKQAAKGGVSEFIIVSNGENLSQIKALIAQSPHLKASKVVVQQDLSTGMAGAILEALPLLKDEEPFLVLSGNDFFEVEGYQEVIAKGKKADGAILSQKVSNYFPGGYLVVDEHYSIQEIIEKPPPEKTPSDLVNIVCHFFSRADILKKALKSATSDKDDVYEKALDFLFKTYHFLAVPYEKTWQAVKYPWHVLSMQQALFSVHKPFISPKSKIDESAKIEGPVIIEEGVRIGPFSTIVGPTYIGKNTIIGNNTLIRESTIEAQCVIGFGSEIARSYLGPHTTTHMAYIGDSVIEGSTNFGAFSGTANLRLDKKEIFVFVKGKRINTHRKKLGAFVGKESQIGMGAKLMPGVKVSPGTFIPPQEVWKNRE